MRRFLFRRGFSPESALLGNAMTMFAGKAMLAALSVISGDIARLDLPAVSLRSWLALGYLVLFGSVVAFNTSEEEIMNTQAVRAVQ